MKPVHILLVEDNEGDIRLTFEAFEESRIKTQISVVRNGKDALDFVFKKGAFVNAPRPDLILLDINLPILNGHEVLQAIKKDENFRKIPIIMLTTSFNQSDINKAYEYHANSYVTKPLDMHEFLQAIIKIEEFWLQIAKFAD